MSENAVYNIILPILFFIGIPCLVLLFRDNYIKIRIIFSSLFTEKSFRVLVKVSHVFLCGMYLLAVLPFEADDYDFDYYDALRLLTIVIGSCLIIKYRKFVTDIRLFGLLAILVLFNPFVVPELPRGTWVPLDIAASFYLFYLFSLIKKEVIK